MDRMLALHAGSRGFDSHRWHMSERFFRSNRPGYPHPVSSELENSGIRVAVGDCSVTERWRWRPPYQTGKTVHVHAKTLQTQRGRTHGAECVRQCFRTAEPLGERRYENRNTHTHVEWFERLEFDGKDAGGSRDLFRASPYDNWKTLFVGPAVNGYLFRIREG